MQSIPGQWNPITLDYNLPSNAIGSKTGGGYIYDTSSVLGTNTSSTATPSTPTSNPSQPSQPSQPSAEEIERQNYINTLNSIYDPMMAGLDPQKSAQEGIVNTQYNSGVESIQSQEKQGMADLASTERKTMENQNKTLKDLTENMRNLMMAGNVYLGSKGAGDSSAANMYGYALGKIGNKNRGDVMSQTAGIVNDIRDRESRLKNTVIQATKDLEADKMTKLGEIAQWYYEAQNQIRGMKGQDLAAMSSTMLQNAINRINQIDTDFRNKQSVLQEWAINNSNTINQLKSNLGEVAQLNPSLPGYNPMSVGNLNYSGGQNYTAPTGFGFGKDEEKK